MTVSRWRKIALPEIDIDAVIATLGVGPQLGRGEGHGVKRLGAALAIDIAVGEDMGAVVVLDTTGSTAGILRQPRMPGGTIAQGDDSVADRESGGGIGSRSKRIMARLALVTASADMGGARPSGFPAALPLASPATVAMPLSIISAA